MDPLKRRLALYVTQAECVVDPGFRLHIERGLWFMGGCRLSHFMIVQEPYPNGADFYEGQLAQAHAMGDVHDMGA